MTPGSSGSWTSSSFRRARTARSWPRSCGDLEDLGELARLEAELVQTLAEDDVEQPRRRDGPGQHRGVLVYENLWAAPFASAMRRAGGQLIANGRIPIQAIIAAVEADEALEL